MHRYNIKHIHFWFVRGNVNNIEGNSQEKLLIALGKYLVETKEIEFVFEYLVEKYIDCDAQKRTDKELPGKKLSNFGTHREESSFSDHSRQSE
jgi:hypothetical protein